MCDSKAGKDRFLSVSLPLYEMEISLRDGKNVICDKIKLGRKDFFFCFNEYYIHTSKVDQYVWNGERKLHIHACNLYPFLCDIC